MSATSPTDTLNARPLAATGAPPTLAPMAPMAPFPGAAQPATFEACALLPSAPFTQTFEIDCALAYQVMGPSEFVFQLHALSGMDQQVLHESMEVTPHLPVRLFADPTLGHRFMRLHVEAGTFGLRYRATVSRAVQPADPQAPEVAISAIPDELLHNLNPTRYCESDLLSRAAQKLFGQWPPGFARVKAIEQWIHDNIDYQVGSTQATTTALDVFVQRAGVCRDFAHLGITFCRALNIPARLVVGYAHFTDPPPDFHAVFEAYLGGRWVLFDATHLSPIDDLVRIATGRDAKDVAFATIFGPATMTSLSPFIRKVG